VRTELKKKGENNWDRTRKGVASNDVNLVNYNYDITSPGSWGEGKTGGKFLGKAWKKDQSGNYLEPLESSTHRNPSFVIEKDGRTKTGGGSGKGGGYTKGWEKGGLNLSWNLQGETGGGGVKVGGDRRP